RCARDPRPDEGRRELALRGGFQTAVELDGVAVRVCGVERALAPGPVGRWVVGLNAGLLDVLVERVNVRARGGDLEMEAVSAVAEHAPGDQPQARLPDLQQR